MFYTFVYDVYRYYIKKKIYTVTNRGLVYQTNTHKYSVKTKLILITAGEIMEGMVFIFLN